MDVLRVIVIFLLGIGFACGAYYSGGAQWMQDRWSDYWAAPVLPPPVVETPVPGPTASTYPGIAPPPAPIVPPPSSVMSAPTPYPPENGDSETDYAPPPPEQAYVPPAAGVPPVGVAPLDASGPPLSLHISIGRRGDWRSDCVPAYTVFNDTTRPIVLTQRAHYRHYGHGPGDRAIVLPGERQVACASDVYAANDRYPQFDYYRQNIWYGPDEIDVPPPVNIRVRQ